jgi:alpha-amylase
VTFIENPDTDGSSPVVTNKLLAYAYLLTAEGYPCVFYRDYATDPGCYGLKPFIDNLIWIHENLAFGTTVTRFKDFQSIVYERQGPPALLVGLNNRSGAGWRTVTVQTAFGGGVLLHDYTGHAGDVWTDAAGRVVIGLPPNEGGRGYVAYARPGVSTPFTATVRPVTQIFEGAADLDIPPVTRQRRVLVGRLWAQAGTTVTARLRPSGGGSSTVLVEVSDTTGLAVISAQTVGQAPADLHGTIARSGWHDVAVTGTDTPDGGLPFSLAVTYTSTQHLGGP